MQAHRLRAHACMHVRTCMHAHCSCAHACMYTARAHMHACTPLVRKCMHAHRSCANACMHTTRAHMHACMHKHTQACTHTPTLVSSGGVVALGMGTSTNCLGATRGGLTRPLSSPCVMIITPSVRVVMPHEFCANV